MINFKGANVGVIYKPKLKEKTITQNGEYYAHTENVAGYNKLVVNVTGPEPFTISLPNSFANAWSVYWFKFNDDKYLISASVNNAGLWVYTKSTDSISQVYAGENWNKFLKYGDKCFVRAAGANSPLLMYEFTTVDTITTIKSDGGIWDFYIFDNKCLVVSAREHKIYLYNQDNTLTMLYYQSQSYSLSIPYSIQVSEHKFLFGGSVIVGVLLFNSTNDTINKIYDMELGWLSVSCQVTESKWLLGRTSNGVIIYNETGDTTTLISDLSNFYAQYMVKIGNKVVISSGSYSGGIYVFNIPDDSVSQVINTNNWIYFIPVGTKCIVCNAGTTTAIRGLWLLDTSDNSFTRIYTTGSKFANYQIVGDNCLIWSTDTDNGLILFDGSNNTATKLNISETVRGDLFRQILGDRCLLSSALMKGYVIYDNLTKSVVKHDIQIGWFDTFEPDGQNCYLYNSDVSENYRKLYYNYTDNSLSLVGARMEA